MFPTKTMKNFIKTVISSHHAFHPDFLQTIVSDFVNVTQKDLVNLSSISLTDSYGPLAQFLCYIPSGGEKVIYRRTCTEAYEITFITWPQKNWPVNFFVLWTNVDWYRACFEVFCAMKLSSFYHGIKRVSVNVFFKVKKQNKTKQSIKIKTFILLPAVIWLPSFVLIFLKVYAKELIYRIMTFFYCLRKFLIFDFNFCAILVWLFGVLFGVIFSVISGVILRDVVVPKNKDFRAGRNFSRFFNTIISSPFLTLDDPFLTSSVFACSLADSCSALRRKKWLRICSVFGYPNTAC